VSKAPRKQQAHRSQKRSKGAHYAESRAAGRGPVGATTSGSATTFDQARSEFDAAWHVFLAKRTEEDFAAWRYQRDFTAWKYAMWDPGLKLPTQTQDDCARCFCGAEIYNAGIHAHVSRRRSRVPAPARQRPATGSIPTCCGASASPSPITSGPATSLTSPWLHPHGAELSVSGGDRRLGQPGGSGMAHIEHDGYLRAYETVGEARSSIGQYLDFYNGLRPHSSLDDRTPDQACFDLPPLRAAAQPRQGSTYRRGDSVQTAGTSSRPVNQPSCTQKI
jgi:hypothetical protein